MSDVLRKVGFPRDPRHSWAKWILHKKYLKAEVSVGCQCRVLLRLWVHNWTFMLMWVMPSSQASIEKDDGFCGQKTSFTHQGKNQGLPHLFMLWHIFLIHNKEMIWLSYGGACYFLLTVATGIIISHSFIAVIRYTSLFRSFWSHSNVIEIEMEKMWFLAARCLQLPCCWKTGYLYENKQDRCARCEVEGKKKELFKK